MFSQRTYQAKHVGPHAFETTGPNAPKWHLIDANGQVVGRLATLIAKILMGKHKPTYTKHADAGDFVVVINADKVVFTRNKWEQKIYRHHTGFISGLKEVQAKHLLERDPEKILQLAVQGMLSKTILSDRQLKKLKIYTGDKHPHTAQNPQPVGGNLIRKTALAKAKKASA